MPCYKKLPFNILYDVPCAENICGNAIVVTKKLRNQFFIFVLQITVSLRDPNNFDRGIPGMNIPNSPFLDYDSLLNDYSSCKI
jgi:hypothetical protein